MDIRKSSIIFNKWSICLDNVSSVHVLKGTPEEAKNFDIESKKWGKDSFYRNNLEIFTRKNIAVRKNESENYSFTYGLT